MADPAGILSLPLAKLAALVAESPTFQAWVGAAGETQALAWVSLIEGGPGPGPYAIVSHGFDWGAESQSGGGPGCYSTRGELLLRFVGATIGAQASAYDAVVDFTNVVGAVLEDMLGVAGVDDRLTVRKIELVDLWRTDEGGRHQDHDTMQAIFSVQYA